MLPCFVIIIYCFRAPFVGFLGYADAGEAMRGAESDIMGLLLRERIVFLGSSINDFVADAIISQLLLLDAQGHTKDICLFINSAGGSLRFHAMMAIKHQQQCHNQSIMSFNPACCMRPPRTHDATRCSDYGPVTCSSSISSSQALIGCREPSLVREPSSPTVGCLGQVKRSNNAKGRYNKLLKFSRVLSGRGTPISLKPTTKVGVIEENLYRISRPAMIRIEEMDPPLPVVIKQVTGDTVSLWKRRHGGEGVNGLQIQQFNQQKIQPLCLHRRQNCA